MATYFMFGKYSGKAMKDMGAERTEKAKSIIKENGGETKGMYALLGQTDLVLIVDLPDLQSAVKTSIALTRATRIDFSTSPAMAVEEFDQLLKKD